MKKNHNNFLNLAFNLARINLGKTKSNPSVGCVIVKNGSVISSGYTSKNGRPHAEFNALNKKKNFKNSDLYVTMEPCTHYGFTPPCTNIIEKKNINKVYFSFNDLDKRTAKKASIILSKKKIKVFKKKSIYFNTFYESYYLNKIKNFPLIDAKLAISKDFYTIHKKKRWITNIYSRNRAHLIRSEYDAIISTSKSINKDNSKLNCRLHGFDENKPDLIILDLKLKIRLNLDLFNSSKKRKIIIITNSSNIKKKKLLLKKGIKFIKIDLIKKKVNYNDLFKALKSIGYNRILVEAGLIFLNELIHRKFINNLYLFKSSIKLGTNGLNNTSNNIVKKLRGLKRVVVNLNGDTLYKIKIK